MPVLELNKPLEQREPVLVVQNRLAVGVHRFALVVVNDRGAESEPSLLSVTVRRVPVLPTGPVLVEPVLVRPDPIGPVAVNPAPVSPVVVNRIDTAVVRPRRKPRNDGGSNGPE